MKEVICDLCGSSSYKHRHTIKVDDSGLRYYRYTRNLPEQQRSEMTGKFNIVQCQNCQLNYVNPRYSTEQLEVVYSSDKIIGGNWQSYKYLFDLGQPDEMQGQLKTGAYNARMYDWKFALIEEHNSTKSRKLLDIGCGDGKFVYEAIQRGFDANGIDLSPDRIEQGRKTYGLGNALRNMNIDDFSADEKFDIITMWDLIEHLESPSSLLAKLEKISHKDTIIVILTMSLDSITYKHFGKFWNYMNPTQHLYYFSHSTLEKMFNKNGLELVAIEMDDSRDKHFIHYLHSIVLGQLNNFIFWLIRNAGLPSLLKRIGREDLAERLPKRLENLYPGKYIGRYHDNFVYIAKFRS